MSDFSQFADALSGAVESRPNAGLAIHRLRQLVNRLDADDHGLHTTSDPHYGRWQLGGDIVADVEAFAEARGRDAETLDRIDYTDAGTAVALIARLLDRDRVDPIAAIRAEVAEICSAEAAAA